MIRTLRSLALAVFGAALLAACGVLNALIPDQTVDDGVLGIGAAGVPVPLEADIDTSAVGAAQFVTATVFTGTLAIDSVDVEAIDALPGFVEANAIEETLALGDSVQVTYPTGGAADTFTLTELALSGSVTISGTEYTFPVYTVDGLAVEFGDASCDLSNVCTYGTVDDLPEIDVALAAAAVAAYSELLQDGGVIAAELTVTATLDAPGLAPDAEVLVTIESLGAVIEF